MFSQEIRGYNRVRNALRKLASQNPSLVQQVGEKRIKEIRTLLRRQKYPAQRPNQKYRRSGELSRRWASQNQQTGRWAITNQASHKGRLYAGYVVGDDQAWMHRGRWWKARDVIEAQMKEFVRALSREIEKIWEE